MQTDTPRAEVIDLLSDRSTTVAVVGANDNPSKYGNRIYRDLKSKGYEVYAVNPNRDEVDGDRCWPSLADLPQPPTIVDFVVPPAVTRKVLEECLDLGLTNVWIQPGAGDEDEAVLEFLRGNEFNHVSDGACIMVETRRA